MNNKEPVVVLDLDGVIIKSNFVKHRAMLAMFNDYPDKRTAVDAYILNNGGVARRDKLVAILETIIGIDATQERLARYLALYAQRLESSLAAAPLVEGVLEFVSRGSHAFYVSSSAPENEVRDQLVRSGLFHRFAEVYGGRTPKSEALKEISRRHPFQPIIFFGDSLGDLEAARAAGTAFVGVTNERNNFKDLEVVELRDFASMEAIDLAIEAAIRTRSNVSS